MSSGLVDLTSEDSRVTIGVGTWAASTPRLRPHHAANRIHIGKYCCFGQNVTIFAGGNHPMHNLTQHHLKLYLGIGSYDDWSAVCLDKDDVTTIGNDVWIGDGAMVMSGVTVGDGAVIGARAVVSKDVPPYTIVAGNRAQVIRKRFSDDTISSLLELRWWDWSKDHLIEVADLLFSQDISGLVKFARDNALINTTSGAE